MKLNININAWGSYNIIGHLLVVAQLSVCWLLHSCLFVGCCTVVCILVFAQLVVYWLLHSLAVCWLLHSVHYFRLHCADVISVNTFIMSEKSWSRVCRSGEMLRYKLSSFQMLNKNSIRYCIHLCSKDKLFITVFLELYPCWFMIVDWWFHQYLIYLVSSIVSLHSFINP